MKHSPEDSPPPASQTPPTGLELASNTSNTSFSALESLLGIETGAVSDSPFAIKWPKTLLSPALQSGGTTAFFIKTDTTTQGNWKGTYGADGYQIINDSLSLPAYAQVTSNTTAASWASSTTAVRALQKGAAGSTDRIASCWYQSPYFTIDVNITDGKAHQLALYSLDWDGANGRSQRIDIINASSGTILDSRSVRAFSNGIYLVWNISGHVIIKVTHTEAGNSVVSGLFFAPARTNVALAANGAVATASSTTPNSQFPGYNFSPSVATDGDRKSGVNFWRDNTANAYPDWLQVQFAGLRNISEVDVFTLQDNDQNPAEPTEALPFSLYGITAFKVEYWDGANWTMVNGGEVTESLPKRVWRKFSFAPVATDKIRVYVTGALASHSRIVELEAYEQASTTSSAPTQSSAAELAKARLDAINRTGIGGEDLVSGNYNWALSLLSLPGRAGLDLGLTLSYNSLVWARAGQIITYDADDGFPSPGFRLGFPTIEPLFYNSQTGKNAYLLVTPSGSRVELRQTADGSNLYESADSSYLQLDGSTMTLRSSDGTQFSYGFSAGAYRCTMVRDRNGNYINAERRIIGLTKTRLLYDRGALSSKVDYRYDWTGEFLQNQGAATQHDAALFHAGFQWRGNLVSIRRWNVLAPTDETQALESRIGYNSTGSVIFLRDASGHQTSISYADSFLPAISLAVPTFAYPTSVTDGDGQTVTTLYNYYLGAVSETQDQLGAVIKTLYDGPGRIDRVQTASNNAFTQWHYGVGYVVTYTTIKSLTELAYAITIFDGLGQVIGSAEQTSAQGSSETRYSGKKFVYDVMGRLEYESNPTEMAGGWVAAGDDLLQANGEGGWRYSQQTYDWKSRPLVSVNQDGTTKAMSYGGCGCAGGEVITVQGEQLAEGLHRTQKLYYDIFGRLVKTEVLNWNGSVYTTTTTEYNARDQVMRVRQYQGSEQNSLYQESLMGYDGYGRLSSRRLPQQDSPTYYSYYADDMLHTATDARGVIISYNYNGRHLLTGIVYPQAQQLPAGVAATANVAFSYDNAGNRTFMSDGVGTATYSYDQLSRMTAETRSFNGVGTYSLSYTYNLAGQLTSLTDDHFGSTLTYNLDHLGRLTSLQGSGAGVSTFISDIKYRAWGDAKQITYGNGLVVNTTYTSRLQVKSFEAPAVLGTIYQYYTDGRLRASSDSYNNQFDRSYSYDQMGRIVEARSGAEARGENTVDGPYRQTYGYDEWGNLTSRFSRHWSSNDSFSAGYDMKTGRPDGATILTDVCWPTTRIRTTVEPTSTMQQVRLWR